MNPNDFPSKNDKQLNPSGKPPLSEKEFIRNGWSLTSLPFWLFFFLLTVVAALGWGFWGSYINFLQHEKKDDPFLTVTNRNFSLFLWQFPSFLRVNVSQKNGYLPGFLATSENFDIAMAEDLVSAPPDLIFLYHTWHRLLAPEFIARPISPAEFEDFLQQLPEWQPKNWKEAPKGYSQLVESKSYAKMDNLQTVPESSLPLTVRQAFQGWKNYFVEGAKINDINPTFAQVKAFLDQHPHYARHFWRNIEEVHDQKVAGSDYLYDLLNTTFIPDATFPKKQLAPFLKVALFNAEQAQQNR